MNKEPLKPIIHIKSQQEIKYGEELLKSKEQQFKQSPYRKQIVDPPS